MTVVLLVGMSTVQLDGLLDSFAKESANESPPRKLSLMRAVGSQLHPDLHAELLIKLRGLDRLVVASCFSPYFVAHVEADDVWCVRGETCARLGDHPEWPAFEGKLDPGEFWASAGEAWLDDYDGLDVAKLPALILGGGL